MTLTTDTVRPADPARPGWRRRLGAHPAWIVISVILVLGLMTLQPLLAIPFVFLFLWLSGATLKDLRLRPFRARDLLVGAAVAAALQLINRLGLLPLLAEFLPAAPSTAAAMGLVPGAWTAFLVFAPIAMVSAGFGEELAARGYAMTRLSALFGDGVAARWATMVLVAVVFGLAHFYQGALGTAHAVAMGVALGALTLIRGSLWASIAAHGVYNVLTALLIVSGGLELLKRLAPWSAL